MFLGIDRATRRPVWLSRKRERERELDGRRDEVRVRLEAAPNGADRTEAA